MGYDINFLHSYRRFIPVVVHKTGTYTWGLSISKLANMKFRRFEGGLLDDRNRKTKNRND
jgi:hypothetical protein